MWPENGDFELLAARAINDQFTSGNAGYDKDFDLMVRLVDEVSRPRQELRPPM